MNFGEALEMLKLGSKMTRENWNGRGMFIFLVPGSEITVDDLRPLGRAVPEMVGLKVAYRAHLDMKTVDDEIVPWVASQTDILAEDWLIALD